MAQPVKYDANVLQKVAEGLYRQADTLEVLYAFVGLGAGVLAGWLVSGRVGGNALSPFMPLLAWAGVAALGCVLGVVAAKSRALALRAQAQTMLCYVRIEQNTAPVAPPPSSATVTE